MPSACGDGHRTVPSRWVKRTSSFSARPLECPSSEEVPALHTLLREQIAGKYVRNVIELFPSELYGKMN